MQSYIKAFFLFVFFIAIDSCLYPSRDPVMWYWQLINQGLV